MARPLLHMPRLLAGIRVLDPLSLRVHPNRGVSFGALRGALRLVPRSILDRVAAPPLRRSFRRRLLLVTSVGHEAKAVHHPSTVNVRSVRWRAVGGPSLPGDPDGRAGRAAPRLNRRIVVVFG